MTDELYIWINGWEKFQHYKNRRPAWIKFYVELLDDDTYLDLTEHRALLLHRLWLVFASSRCRLRLDTRSLSRHTFLRVTTADIESLSQAGYISIVDSTALAEREHLAMPDKEVEEEKEHSFLPTEAREPAIGDDIEWGDAPSPPRLAAVQEEGRR